jgi:hypothetical protein
LIISAEAASAEPGVHTAFGAIIHMSPAPFTPALPGNGDGSPA